MSAWGWIRLVLGLSVALAAYAFYVQNSLRAVDLSLDLWFAAWRLSRPIPVPALMAACFGAGLLLAGGWGWLRGLQLQGQIRRLQQELAMAPLSSGRDRSSAGRSGSERATEQAGSERAGRDDADGWR